MKAVYLIAMLLLSSAPVYGAVPDYLKPVSSEVTPSYTAKIGQGVNARLVLEGDTPVPDEARLNVSTSVARPRVEVTIDGKLEWFGTPELEIPLPAEGVKGIEIRVFGDAPEVTKETKVVLLEVRTYVKYKGEEGVYQDDGRLSITVSNVVISGAVEAIDSANAKLAAAEKTVDELKAKGAGTASLEAKLKNAGSLIATAETLYEKGDTELAKGTAESAIKILDDALSEAVKVQESKETKRDITKYALAVGAVIIIGGGILLFMRRREELG